MQECQLLNEKSSLFNIISLNFNALIAIILQLFLIIYDFLEYLQIIITRLK